MKMVEDDVSQETQKEDKSETQEALEKKKAELEMAQSKKPLSPLEEAKEVNKKKEELLEREEKLIERKEKFLAEERVGGRAEAGSEADTKEETPKEYAERIKKNDL